MNSHSNLCIQPVFIFIISETEGVADNEEDDEDEDEDDDIPLAIMAMAKDLFGCSFNELSALDRQLHTCDNSTKDWDRPATQIIDEIQQADSDLNNSSDSEEEEEDSRTHIYSLSEMEEVIRRGKEFALANGNSVLLNSMITSDESLMDMRMDCNTTRQKKMTDFFC